MKKTKQRYLNKTDVALISVKQWIIERMQAISIDSRNDEPTGFHNWCNQECSCPRGGNLLGEVANTTRLGSSVESLAFQVPVERRIIGLPSPSQASNHWPSKSE